MPAAPAVDNGCETNTDDPSNCGGCGKVCNLPNTASYQCPSGTCGSLTCNAGYVDCNGAFDADGCECQTGAPNPGGCCGTGCQTVHSNGPNNPAMGEYTGQNYFDCYPLGIPGTSTTPAAGGFDPTVPTNSPNQMAVDARAAFQFPTIPGPTSDPSFTCGDTMYVTSANCQARKYNAPDGKQHCVTWCFGDDPSPNPSSDKNSACHLHGDAYCGIGGHVYDAAGSAGSVNCRCPWPTDPSWN
jgi:hypothetical protein